MNRLEFQLYHGFTYEEMQKLEAIIAKFEGKIIAIKDNPNVEVLRVL